ncbi:hypothetical protein HUS2011_0386 [Escherichia coli]|nr:hypothetical protein HUS2011_0386 [Escherichia coli]
MRRCLMRRYARLISIYGLWAKCRPDKAFTPHPAVVRHA